MSIHKLCCIGYITNDTIVTPVNTTSLPGGTAWYFAKAIKQLSTDDFLLVTAVEEEQQPVIEELRGEGIDVITVPTRRSACFVNIYDGNLNSRKQRVTAQPDPFTIESLQTIDADIIHLGSLLRDDFSADAIKLLSSKATLSVDVQGFLRKVSDEQVQHIDWEEKRELLPYIHTLKANETEMEVLTGTSDPYEAALILKDLGVKEVILTLGDKGSLIYHRGQYHDIPAYPTLSLVDVTGCGDTYMAGYLLQRSLGKDEDEAGRFAAAMCTVKLQDYGPFNSTEKVVRRIMSSSY